MRILLFLATNIAVIMLLSLVFNVLGLNGLLQANGVDLDMNALLVYSAVIGFAGSFISLFMSKFMAKKSMAVQVINEPRNSNEQWLVNTVARQAEKAGIGMPEVGIFPSQAPNAFATGWNRNNALVAVSAGLLQHMTQDEIEAVLGHEVAHVANGDMVTLTLIQGVVNTFVIFLSRVIGHVANGDMVTLALVQGVVNTFVMFLARVAGFFVDRVILKNERGLGMGYFITSIVMELLLGMLAMTVVMWVSRRREFRADAFGARLAGRDAMIAALERLRVGDQLPDAMPATMQAFGIRSGTSQGFKALLRSHPPLEARIEALRRG